MHNFLSPTKKKLNIHLISVLFHLKLKQLQLTDKKRACCCGKRSTPDGMQELLALAFSYALIK